MNLGSIAQSLGLRLPGNGGHGRGETSDTGIQPEPRRSDDDVLSLVQKRFGYARDAKLDMLETWATSLAFFVGEQWRQWDDRQQRLVKQTRIPSWRVLPVYNQLPGITDLAAAKLARARQLPRARPDDANDPRDQERARRGTQALHAWWHHEELDLLEHEANVGRIILGSSFFHLYWDPHRLAKIPVPDPVSGAVQARYGPVGQLGVEVLTPFDVFPEPAEHWRDVSWCIVARRRPLHWFRSMFGPIGAKVEVDSGDAEGAFTGLIPGRDGSSQGSSNSGGVGNGAPEGDGQATLKTYYERPCRSYPKGRTVMVAGSQVLFQHDSLPLPFLGLKNPLPVKMLGYRHVPKRLWPKGLIEECVSPQRELNRARGNISEWLRLHRGPKWFLDKAWKVDPKAITSAPDEVVEGNFNGSVPHPIPPPGMPGWLAALPESEREEMRHLAGQHEVSNGQVPAGVSAASAIQLLQQSENTRRSSPALLGKAGLEDTAKHALTVMAERYREPRMITVPGRHPGAGQEQQTAIIRGEEIGPLEVVVELAAGVEDNDAIRQQQLFDWLKAGLLELTMSPMGPILLQMLRDVGQGWIADIVDRHGPQMQAQMKLQAMAQMVPGVGQGQGAGPSEGSPGMGQD